MSYRSPITKDQYWSVVNNHWKELENIFLLYLPIHINQWIYGSEIETNLGEYLKSLKNSKNTKIIRAFHFAYFSAPENVNSWNTPCWNVLCDLCYKEKIFFN